MQTNLLDYREVLPFVTFVPFCKNPLSSCPLRCYVSFLFFAVQTLGIVHFLEDSLLGGDSAELVDVGGVSGAERSEDKSPGWG